MVCSVSLGSLKTVTAFSHTHTCNETVFPGNGGQVVAVDIALKQKDFSRLKNQKSKRKRGSVSYGRNSAISMFSACVCMLNEHLNFMIKYTAVTLNKAMALSSAVV